MIEVAFAIAVVLAELAAVGATEAAKSFRPMRRYRSWLDEELRKVRQDEEH